MGKINNNIIMISVKSSCTIVFLALIASTSFLSVLASAISNASDPQDIRGRKASCFVIGDEADAGVDTTTPNYVEDLITSFSVDAHNVKILDQCWDGFDVQVMPPTGEMFRVNQYYNFSVSVYVRQPGRNSVTNDTTSSDLTFPGLITPQNYAFVRLLLCDFHSAGICTPYSSFTEATKINTTLVEELLASEVATSGQDGGAAYVMAEIPAPDWYSALNEATPFYKIALRPTINVTIDNNGSANVFTADGQLVAGTGSYVNQGATLIVSLNVTSGKVKEDRTFLLIGKHR